jgi:hypothetical protein
MNKIEDDILRRNIEKNSINIYASEATNLIKENLILRQLIDFYKNHNEMNKSKILNYFDFDKNFLKEILIYDLKEFNNHLEDFNNKNKELNSKLNIKLEDLKEKLTSNISILNEEKEKIKEDVFILFNENQQKDSIIKILEKEKKNLIYPQFFQEEIKTNFDYEVNKIINFLEKELKYTQDTLISKSKHHNSQIKRVNSLDKLKKNLLTIINKRTNTKNSSPNLKVKASNLIVKNPIYKVSKNSSEDDDFLFDNNIFFGDFEEEDSQEKNDTESENTKSYINDMEINFEDKVIKSELNLISHNRIKNLTSIPKLNLKQIEFNKSKITKKNFHHKKGNSCVDFGVNDINQQIKELKEKIKEIKKKNKRIKNIINKFEEFYLKIKNKMKYIENTLTIDIEDIKSELKELDFLISQ